MVADDEKMVRVVSGRMLESLGFKVLTAVDGHDAVNVFRKHSEQIVCILLDLTMPNLDGEQAFHEIRRIRSDVPVVLSSGYNMQDATQCFVGKGLAGFIQKPYDQSTLRETMKEVLGAEGNEAEES